MIKNYLKAVIVDDEERAIKALSTILSDFCKEITIVGTAKNVDEAIQVVNTTQPDVIFLDIEMPEKSGFALLNSINDSIQVVFVTAYNQYAIRAFEVSAVDYLLKPIEIKRLLQTVKKLHNNLVSNRLQINAVKENIQHESIQKLVLPHLNNYISIALNDIICMEANGMYTNIYYEKANKLVKKTFSNALKVYEDYVVDCNNFMRVHRSWIIAKNKIESYNKSTKTILLENDITIPLSRSKTKIFTDWFYENN